MRRRGLAACLIAFLGCALNGCGTFVNMISDPERQTILSTSHTPYGGVQLDGEFTAIGVIRALDGKPVLTALGLGALCDLPFSLVGDSVTLPFVLAAAPPQRIALPVDSALNHCFAGESAVSKEPPPALPSDKLFAPPELNGRPDPLGTARDGAEKRP